MKPYFSGVFIRAVLWFSAALIGVPATYAAKVGDSLEQVLAEKGAPKSQVAAGTNRILTYADVTLKLKDNVVVSMTANGAPAPTKPNAPAASAMGDTTVAAPAAADKAAAIADVQRRLRGAVRMVENIVNQPVETVPITRA